MLIELLRRSRSQSLTLYAVLASGHFVCSKECLVCVRTPSVQAAARSQLRPRGCGYIFSFVSLRIPPCASFTE